MGLAALTILMISLLIVQKEVLELLNAWLVQKLQQVHAESTRAGRHYGLPT